MRTNHHTQPRNIARARLQPHWGRASPQSGNHSSPAVPHPPQPGGQHAATSSSRSDGSCWLFHFHQHAGPLAQESTTRSQPLHQVSHTSRVGLQGQTHHSVRVCHWLACIARHVACVPLRQQGTSRSCLERGRASLSLSYSLSLLLSLFFWTRNGGHRTWSRQRHHSTAVGKTVTTVSIMTVQRKGSLLSVKQTTYLRAGTTQRRDRDHPSSAHHPS